MGYGLFTGISIEGTDLVAHGDTHPSELVGTVTAFHVKAFALDNPERNVEGCNRESAGDEVSDPWHVKCANTPAGYAPFINGEFVVVVGSATLGDTDIPFLWHGFFKIKPVDPQDSGEVAVSVV